MIEENHYTNNNPPVQNAPLQPEFTALRVPVPLKQVQAQHGYYPVQLPLFYVPCALQPQLVPNNEVAVPYTVLTVNHPSQNGTCAYRPDYGFFMPTMNMNTALESQFVSTTDKSSREDVLPVISQERYNSRIAQFSQVPYVSAIPQSSVAFSQSPMAFASVQKPRPRFSQPSTVTPSFQHPLLNFSAQLSAKRPQPPSSRLPAPKYARSAEEAAVEMLCKLSMTKKEVPVPTVPSTSAPSSTPSTSTTTQSTTTRGPSHAICPQCHKRVIVSSTDPPSSLTCVCCNTSFPTIPRFIHDFAGRPDGDPNLELPCLRGIHSTPQRHARIKAYTAVVLAGRRCSYSTSIREIQRMLAGMVSKVSKAVTRELRRTEEECQQVMEGLLARVEQYVEGELHCHCLQPAYPQRHFIQCDRCDLWFHTSCVGVDSRKLASITSFVCPWCEGSEAKVEMPPEESVECVCPLCDRVFPRPCNLSRHLHAKHSMKWNTHVMMHMDVNDYLELETKDTKLPRGTVTHMVCEGCYASDNATDVYEMDKVQFRYLLRKLRGKPSQWWIGKEIRIRERRGEKMVPGVIKCIRPRSEFCVKLNNGSTMLVANLFDPRYRIRLLILNGNFELELMNALPSKRARDVKIDMRMCVQSTI